MSNGHGASGGKGVTGGAKKVMAIALAIFVLMMIAPNVGVLMNTAHSMGGAVAGMLHALGQLAHQLTAAFHGA